MRRALIALLVGTALCSPARAEDAIVSGTWVHVEKWIPRRADVAPQSYTASAIVLRFCPNGQFRMLKCMLYRQGTENTQIGPDDGLQIYRGTWTAAPDGAVITYHLADAEIPFPGYEAARQQQIKVIVSLLRQNLQIHDVKFFGPDEKFTETFRPKADLPAPLEEKFVSCDDQT